MIHLVLTVVGDDRPGLVGALAQRVAEAGGNWEKSELAELGGAFAGIVLVSVPDDRVDELTASLRGLEGLLKVATHAGSVAPGETGRHTLSFTVLGNDRAGIVRDVTDAISAHALSIDVFRSRILDAPMAGGTLFEASVEVSVPTGVDATEIIRSLESLAAEIQVDVDVTVV